MNLAEMANYICTKVNQTEAEDVAAAKGFIRRRYELIYNDQLWKDSIAAIDMTLDPDNADNAQGVVVLPPLIDRPIAVRGANRGILVNPLERYYRVDLDMFVRQGTQYEMALLSPAWATIRPNTWTDVPYGVLSTITFPPLTCNEGDIFRIENPDGVQLAADSLSGNCITGGHLPLGTGTPLYFQAIADGTFRLSQSNAVSIDTITISVITLNNQSSGAGATMTITSSDASDTSNIKVVWRDLSGKRYETTAALPTVTLTPDDDAGYFEIEAIYKNTTTGNLTVTLVDGTGLTFVIGTLLAADTRSPSYQRIRVFDIPNQSADIKVAGKIKVDALDFDNQEPQLRGCENVLLAFGQGDMLERERQYGKAAEKFQEAVTLLEQFKRLEVVQQAHNMRIIPEHGFVTEYDLYASNLLSF